MNIKRYNCITFPIGFTDFLTSGYKDLNNNTLTSEQRKFIHDTLLNTGTPVLLKKEGEGVMLIGIEEYGELLVLPLDIKEVGENVTITISGISEQPVKVLEGDNIADFNDFKSVLLEYLDNQEIAKPVKLFGDSKIDMNNYEVVKSFTSFDLLKSKEELPRYIILTKQIDESNQSRYDLSVPVNVDEETKEVSALLATGYSDLIMVTLADNIESLTEGAYGNLMQNILVIDDLILA